MSGSKLLPEEWSLHKPAIITLIRIHASSNPSDCERARWCGDGLERKDRRERRNDLLLHSGELSVLFAPHGCSSMPRWCKETTSICRRGGEWVMDEITLEAEPYMRTSPFWRAFESSWRRGDFCGQQCADGCTVCMTPPVDSGVGATMPVVT